MNRESYNINFIGKNKETNEERNKKKRMKVLRSLHVYFLFFLLVSFIITCNMILFLKILYNSPFNNIEAAARLTFGNVLFLSLVLTVVYVIIKRVTVKVPAKRITDAAEKIMNGDFSARVKISSFFGRYEILSDIADCFNKMASELDGVETLRTDFISNVSHEIKTPLAVIKNYTTLLQNDNVSEDKKQEYLKRIEEASLRLSNLISNILKLNKLDNQQILPVFERYNLSESLCENIIAFESIWESKNINLLTDIADDIIINSDREMLDIVWSNLLSNAFKFTGPDGNVTVRAYKEKGCAVVEIEDSGCGISEDVGKRMFDKFYQGDTSRAMQGNGLGLSLVKRIVDITDCSIFIESKVNEGTTFTVKLRSE